MMIIDRFKAWWKDHGTKLLGGATTFVGVLQEIVSYIQAADPKRAALWALVVALGVATVKRGFTNSKMP